MGGGRWIPYLQVPSITQPIMHITGFLLKVWSFRNILTQHKSNRGRGFHQPINPPPCARLALIPLSIAFTPILFRRLWLQESYTYFKLLIIIIITLYLHSILPLFGFTLVLPCDILACTRIQLLRSKEKALSKRTYYKPFFPASKFFSLRCFFPWPWLLRKASTAFESYRRISTYTNE